MIGITITDCSDADAIIKVLLKIPQRLTARIVCDPGMESKDYEEVVNAIGAHADIIIQPVDSAGMENLSQHEHYIRWTDYLARFGVNPYVIAFEVGNEPNGDWTYKKGHGPLYTADKVREAFGLARKERAKTLLTMFVQDLDGDPQFEIFNWLKTYQMPEPDYIGLSVYPMGWKNPPSTSKIFYDLEKMWPDAKQIISEFGAEGAKQRPSLQTKAKLLDEWYLPAVGTFIGGGFYWDWVEDCVKKLGLMPAFLKAIEGLI